MTVIEDRLAEALRIAMWDGHEGFCVGCGSFEGQTHSEGCKIEYALTLYESAREPTMLTDEDVADLRAALVVEGPAYYKGAFHFNHKSLGVVRFLRRQGFRVDADEDTGRVTVEALPDEGTLE